MLLLFGEIQLFALIIGCHVRNSCCNSKKYIYLEDFRCCRKSITCYRSSNCPVLLKDYSLCSEIFLTCCCGKKYVVCCCKITHAAVVMADSFVPHATVSFNPVTASCDMTAISRTSGGEGRGV